MNCQHCGKKLPLLRKFKGGEFCSEEHRAAYSSESDRLALRRLIETPGVPLRSVKAPAKAKGFKQKLEDRNGPPVLTEMLPLTATAISQHGCNILLGSLANFEPMGRELTLGYFRGAKPRARLWLPVGGSTTMGLVSPRAEQGARVGTGEPDLICSAAPQPPKYGADLDKIDWSELERELGEAERRAEAGPARPGLIELGRALSSLAPVAAPQPVLAEREPALAGALKPQLRYATSSPEAALNAAPTVDSSRQRRLRPTTVAPRTEPPLAGLTPAPARVTVKTGSLDGKLGVEQLPTVLGRRPTWPAQLKLRASGEGMPTAGNVPLVSFGRSTGHFRPWVLALGDPRFSIEPAIPGMSRAARGLPAERDVAIPLPAVSGERAPVEIVAAQPLPSILFLEAPGSVPLRAPLLDPPLSTLRALSMTVRNPPASRRPALAVALAAVTYEVEIDRLPETDGRGRTTQLELARLARSQGRAAAGALAPTAGELQALPLADVKPSISSAAGSVIRAGGAMKLASRLFPLPADRMQPRDSGRRPKDEPVPAEPRGFLILSSSRLTIRKDPESGLGRLRFSMPKLPALGNLPKWGAGLMLVLAVGVFLSSGAPKASGTIAPSEPSPWANLQRTILNRAAVALTDDFRGGLGDWVGHDGWGKSWSFDPTGFARTGSLALYSPSVGLNDYRFEFLGQIEKKALSWVVRAADLENYQVVRLELSGSGPVPRGVVVRYPVIDGRKGSVTRTDLPMAVTTDTVYRVAMEIHGADHTLMVQGQVVDSWTEKRLKHGGIGFFSAAGERARLRWVGVWHQYDALGRLCAYLVPRQLGNEE